MDVSIGLIEFTSIACGIEASDVMLKAAHVTLDFAKPVCPGKFIVMVHGEIGAIEAAIKAGLAARPTVVNHLVIPRTHPDLIPAVNATLPAPDPAALGVVEYFDITSAVIGADTAAKASNIALIEVRLGMGIGGKSFVKLTGQVSDVTTAVKAAERLSHDQGSLVSTCVIPSPSPALFREML
ncbi:MAG: BMC domain-containing protein [Propionibacteriaceae bacterium]|jgi:microcompartment protein CcmL/EutN|nr:BMC domain-containing protein [Propionibacteriaceae bacterium]